MSDVLDLSSYRTLKELRSYTQSLYSALLEAHQKVKALQSEIEHLKMLLLSAKALPVVRAPIELEVSDERAISEIELKRLKEIAHDRALTFEETKRFDLLVKNLLLTKTNSNILAEFRKIAGDITDADLLSAASSEDP